MGLGAEMEVSSPLLTSAEQVRRLSYEVCAGMGVQLFWLDRKADQHALKFVEPGLLAVSLFCRYYAQGYERGPWPDLAALMRFFRLRLPECEVRYGSDAGGVSLFTQTDEDEMWSHWAHVQGRPYHESFGGIGTDDIQGPVCAFCRVPMTRNGWGGGFASYYCYCGARTETRDGGKAWNPTTKES